MGRVRPRHSDARVEYSTYRSYCANSVASDHWNKVAIVEVGVRSGTTQIVRDVGDDSRVVEELIVTVERNEGRRHGRH